MFAVQHERYGSAQEALITRTDVATPKAGPDDLVVRILATSVNPIDCAVRGGYGATYWESVGFVQKPHTPGRDVAGEVVEVGANVTAFQLGDRVWAGVLYGASAEYIVLPASWVAPKPRALSYLEAASLPYAALTAWSALVKRAGVTPKTAPELRVLVPRGAGGVGSFAIQLMKAWGAHVATVCSTGSIPLVKSLGADVVVDYKTTDYSDFLHDYDVAFDTLPGNEEKLLATLRTTPGTAYVSIVSPKLQLIDQLGLEAGLAAGQKMLEDRKSEAAKIGRIYDWSFMEPDGAALTEIGKLVDAGAIRPVVDRVFSIHDLPAAQAYCESGAARGKIVVNIAVGDTNEGRGTPFREPASAER